MNESDGELLLRYARERSEAAFRALVDRHTRMVFAICRRKLGDQQLAEDATQMVFAALASNAQTLEPGPLAGYLAKTAIYISGNLGKARAARKRHEQRFQEALRPMREPDEVDDRLEAVQAALAHLGPTYRDAVTLRYIAGLSVEGVAGALEISPETAKKRLVRALAHLRQRLQDQGFAMSLWLAAGLLRRLREEPPVGLSQRICDAVLSGSATQAPRPRPKLRRPPANALLGTAAALTGVYIVVAAFMPRVQSPVPAPALRSATLPSPPGSQPVALEVRLGRRIPDFYDHATSFASTLVTVSQLSGIPIDPQWDSIEASGISRDTVVKIELHNMSARQQLDEILNSVAPGKLEYVIAGDHLVVRARTVQQGGGQTAAVDHR